MRPITWLIGATVACVALSGCSNGGGGAGTGDSLANGRAALNRVVSGTSPSDTNTLQSILADFQAALRLNPNSAEANFGYAICLAGVAGNDLDGGPGSGEVTSDIGGPGRSRLTSVRPSGLPEPPTTGEVPPAPPNHSSPIHPLPPAHRLGLIWNLDGSLANPYALLNMLAPIGSLQYGLIPYYGYSQDATDVARRMTLLEKLTTVSQHLAAVEAAPDFSTTLPDPSQPNGTIAVGLPEVFLFDAYVNSLRTQVALSLAYVRDPGGVQHVPTPVPQPGGGSGKPEPPIFAVATVPPDVSGGNTGSGPTTIYAALDKNGDGKLTPAEYLPASPYLTLRDAALLATAQHAMQTVVDRETKGIAGVLARSSDAVFLVSNTQQVHDILVEVRDKVLPIIQEASTGPVTIVLPHYQPLGDAIHSADPPPPPPGTNAGGVFSIQPAPVPGGSEPPLPPIFTTETVKVNIAAWFASPPADLKAFAPTYTLTTSGGPDFTKTVYPDKTFGGLFPDGLPSDFLF